MALAYSAGPAVRHTSIEIGKKRRSRFQETDDDTSHKGERWSIHGLRNAKNNPEISCVLNFIEQYTEKPPRNVVSLQTHDVKTHLL